MDSHSEVAERYITACYHLSINYNWGQNAFDRIARDLQLNPTRLRLIWAVFYASRRAEHTSIAHAATRTTQSIILGHQRSIYRNKNRVSETPESTIKLDACIRDARKALLDAASSRFEQRDFVMRLLQGREYEQHIAQKYRYEDIDLSSDSEESDHMQVDEQSSGSGKQDKIDQKTFKMICSAVGEFISELELSRSMIQLLSQQLVTNLISIGALSENLEDDETKVIIESTKNERIWSAQKTGHFRRNQYSPKLIRSSLATRMAMYRAEAMRWTNKTDNPSRMAAQQKSMIQLLSKITSESGVGLHPFTLRLLKACYANEDDLAEDAHSLKQFAPLLRDRRIDLLDRLHWRQVKRLYDSMVEPDWDISHHLISIFQSARRVLRASKNDIASRQRSNVTAEKIMYLIHGDCTDIRMLLDTKVGLPYLNAHVCKVNFGSLEQTLAANFDEFINAGSDECSPLYLTIDERLKAYQCLHTSVRNGDKEMRKEFEASWFIFEIICYLNLAYDGVDLTQRLIRINGNGREIIRGLARNDGGMWKSLPIKLSEEDMNQLVESARRYLACSL